MNLLWVDKVFGLMHVEGLMVWLKVSPQLEDEDTSIVEELASHFQISSSIIETLVKTPGNLIADYIQKSLGRRPSPDTLRTKIDHSQCPNKQCDKMNLCRIQWGSRNLSRAVFGDNSFFGLNEINFSLPITFEFTDKPELYLTTQEAVGLLSVNYRGYQNEHPGSLLNITNVNYLLANLNDSKLLADRFLVSEAKAAALAKWVKRMVKSVKIIEANNFELAYFRGRAC